MNNLKNFDIVSKWKIWLLVPVIVVLVALIVFFAIGAKNNDIASGMNIGIDFTGGTILTVTLGEGADDLAKYNENVEIISEIIRDNGCVVSQYQKSNADEASTSSIDFRYKNPLDGNAMDDLNTKIKTQIAEHYGKDANDTTFITSESIGVSASKGLLKSAFLASLIAMALILVYVIFRFELWSGITAIIALLHDIIIMVAFTIIFQVQVNSSFVAAVVTIIAYSINNTIVIFDRVREQLKKFDDKSRASFDDIANEAIINTLTRTLFTSATTLITVVLLAILGVTTMREFTLPIMFGLVAGTYSSIFVATPVWARIQGAIQSKSKKAKTTFKTQKSK